MGQAPDGVGGGMTALPSGEWVTGLDHTVAQASSPNPDFTSWQTYAGEYRVLATQLRFEYIGPHGDNQTGFVVVNLGGIDWALGYGTIQYGYSANEWCVPFTMDDSASGIASAEAVLNGDPSARTFRVGTDFVIDLPSIDVTSQDWRDANAGVQGYGQTWLPSVAGTSIASATQMDQFAGLSSCAVAIYGGAPSTSLYILSLVRIVELQPLTAFRALIPTRSTTAREGAVSEGRSLFARMRETVARAIDATAPYAGDWVARAGSVAVGRLLRGGNRLRIMDEL